MLLRLIGNQLSYSAANVTVYNISAASVSVQSVRWRRKPRWLPVAKSKLYRVPERKQQDADEKVELLRLNNNYRTQMRSLRAYFHEECAVKNKISTSDHLVVTPEEEEAEFQKCFEINNKWNEKCAAIRDARLQRNAEQENELIEQRLEAKLIRDQEAFEKAEEIVRREKVQAKTFIDKHNLDQAIEYALANQVDYSYVIDLNRNIFHGRNTPAVVQKDETLKIAASQ